jgi:hypothetical protein
MSAYNAVQGVQLDKPKTTKQDSITTIANEALTALKSLEGKIEYLTGRITSNPIPEASIAGSPPNFGVLEATVDIRNFCIRLHAQIDNLNEIL